MRTTVTVIAIAFASALSLSGAFAQQVAQQEVGGWQVLSVSQPDNEIDPVCIIRSPRTDGQYMEVSNPLHVRGGRRGNALMTFVTSELLSDQSEVSLPGASIGVDGGLQWRADMRWVKLSDSRVAAVTGRIDDNIDNVIRPIAAGRTLELVATTADGREHRFSVDLTGSSRALAEYEKCLAKVRIAPE